MVDVRLLLTLIFTGILVDISYLYAYYAPNSKMLWAGISPRYRTIYAVSGIIASLALLYSIVYHCFIEVDKEDYKITLAYLLIIIPAALWVPATFLGLKNPRYKFLSVLTLLLTSIGGILLLIFTVQDKRDNKNPAKMAAIISLSLFVFHTTVLDLISWSPGYLSL